MPYAILLHTRFLLRRASMPSRCSFDAAADVAWLCAIAAIRAPLFDMPRFRSYATRADG